MQTKGVKATNVDAVDGGRYNYINISAILVNLTFLSDFLLLFITV